MTPGQTLNISPGAEAEAPTIDFAGADRTVPWTTWYEPHAALGGKLQVLGSRVDGTGGQWIPQGQNRSAALPSLNIHTGSDVENPAVTSGATLASNVPMPWVACHAHDDAVSSPQDQIFVSNGVQQTTAQHHCHRAPVNDARRHEQQAEAPCTSETLIGTRSAHVRTTPDPQIGTRKRRQTDGH